MKVVIAPDSFKKSLSAEKCCQAIRAGFSTILPDTHYVCLPIADGGEGAVDTMVAATDDNVMTLEVYGSMGETVNTFYDLTGGGKTATIEMAAASGLMLVASEKRNPLLASGFGTRELIRHALDNSIRRIILSIGGSATVDGNVGMTQVLGVRFLDADNRVLAVSGGNLTRVAGAKMGECDPRLTNYHIEVARDINNPLAGTCGVAAMFGPQKGATPGIVGELEQGLQNYTRALQQQTEINVCQIAGGGAASGTDIAATVFLSANTRPGIEVMLNTVNLTQAVQGAALVITGEGRIDSRTAGGKAPLDMASMTKQFNVPVIGITGVLGDSVEAMHQYDIGAIFSILPHLAPLAEVLASDETNLFNSTRNIACATRIDQGIKN